MLSINFVGVIFLQELGSFINNTAVHRHIGTRCCFYFLRSTCCEEDGLRGRLKQYDIYRNSEEVDHLMLRMLVDSRGLILAGIVTGFFFAGDVVTGWVLPPLVGMNSTKCIYSCPVISAEKKRLMIDEGVVETLCKMMVVVPCTRLACFVVKRWGVEKLAAVTSCNVQKVRFAECLTIPEPLGLFVCGYAAIAVSSVWTALMINFGK